MSKFKRTTEDDIDALFTHVGQLASANCKANKRISELVELVQDTRDKSADVIAHLHNELTDLRGEFNELRDHTAVLITEHDRQLDGLSRNGVVTAINKLNKEVFEDRKDEEDFAARAFAIYGGDKLEEVTLRGQVKAIAKKLNLDFEITDKEVKESEVVAKTVKTTKKKGRR